MTGRALNAFRAICREVDRLERGVLAVLVTGIVLLAAVQILLRNIWHSGFPWAEPLLGMGLLWLTMLGALAAAGLGRHLSIDLAAALLPRRWAGGLARIVSLFAAVVCVLLAWAAGHYVGFQRDMAMGDLLGLPVWRYYQIIPVAFWLMAFRFLIRAAIPASWLALSDDDDGLAAGEGRVPL
ncbi:MAG: TRAP transporter small permease subunit [Lentisphaerae bacterium]|nr:TRAP transporter small permease subunit [Lentisphaerota bacterium]